MKRRNRVFLLLGVLAVVCGLTFSVSRIKEYQEKIQNTDEIILSVDTESVNALSWEYGETSLSFHKSEDVWKWDEDEAFPVDTMKIENLLSCFQELGADFIIEEVEDYSQYGLEEPTCKIEIGTEEQTYEIVLGAYSTMDSERYVTIGDDCVYLVREDPFESYEIELKDTILDDEIPIFEKISSIKYSGKEEYEIQYVEDSNDSYCEDDIYFTSQNGKTVPLDTDRVDAYFSNISSLSQANYVSYNASDEELSTWGFDEPELTTTVQYILTDEDENETTESFVIHVGRNQEELAKITDKEENTESSSEENAEENSEDTTEVQSETIDSSEDMQDEEEVTAYIRIGDSRIIYQISNAEYEALMAASYNDLRHDELMTAAFDQITQIDIVLEGENYQITSQKEEDEDTRIYSYQEEEIDLKELRSQVKGMFITEFVQDIAKEKEELRMTFGLDHESISETTIELYRYDGESCLAVLDGETVGFVNRSDVVDLIEAIHAIVLGK